MRLSVLALVCLLSACPSNPCANSAPPGDGGGGGDVFPGGGSGFTGGGDTSTGGGNQAVRVVLVGQQATVTTTAGLVLDSCELLVSPTGATSTVVGPDNLPVMSTENGLSDNSGLNYSENVVFTPQQPGDFHIETNFEPNLGVAQLDVLAVVDRTSLPAHDTYAFAVTSACNRFLVTDLGTLLCGDESNIKIHAFRAGAEIDARDGSMMAVHGNSIWIVDSSEQNIFHFVDTGASALFVDDPPVVVTDSEISGLLPGDSDVVALVNDHAALYVLADAGVIPDGGLSAAYEWTGGNGLSAAARTGTTLIACGNGALFASTDGGSNLAIVTGTQDQLCVGFGPEGVWTVDSTTGALAVFAPGTHSPAATVSGFMGWSNPSNSSDLPFSYGVEATTLVTIANEQQTLSETWDPDAGLPVPTAWGTSSAYWLMPGWAVAQNSSGLVVVERIPAP